MRKIALIARREFMAAVMSRGFVVGLLVMPAIVALATAAIPRLMRAPGAPVRGEVAVIDPTGEVLGRLRASLSMEAAAGRRDALIRSAPAARAADAVNRSSIAAQVLGSVSHFDIVARTPADLDDEKRRLIESPERTDRIALVVVHDDAVRPPAGGDYGAYDLYLPANVAERVEAALHEGVRDAVVSARVVARNLDREEIEEVLRVSRPVAVRVTASGEQRVNAGLNRALPFAFAALLVFGVMIGAQTLMTSTVEEKSSRVIEVLLSAVSPLELMAGKILGQMAVSLLVLALYIGLGLLMLASFALLGLLDPWLLVYLVLFFLITYLIFAALFGAVGAAVNDMREAQSLIMPVMTVLMLPWILATPIARDPDSTLSIVLSFTPLMNMFAMMVRLSSATPPPAWQVWLTMGIGIATACGAIWFASKVFKAGLLMHGRPPNFATLLRWARAA
jgi:ABC-2 type transport system permease protein